jgi:ectoine hydroxylase-related dioxygenase (phytanoyl-CoA dioxygenase family)
MLQGTPVLPDIGEPVQLLARPGDVVLAHYQLLHGAANNTSAYPRYAVFFRVHHRDHHLQGMDIFGDLWREYAGVRDVL